MNTTAKTIIQKLPVLYLGALVIFVVSSIVFSLSYGAIILGSAAASLIDLFFWLVGLFGIVLVRFGVDVLMSSFLSASVREVVLTVSNSEFWIVLGIERDHFQGILANTLAYLLVLSVFSLVYFTISGSGR